MTLVSPAPTESPPLPETLPLMVSVPAALARVPLTTTAPSMLPPFAVSVPSTVIWPAAPEPVPISMVLEASTESALPAKRARLVALNRALVVADSRPVPPAVRPEPLSLPPSTACPAATREEPAPSTLTLPVPPEVEPRARADSTSV